MSSATCQRWIVLGLAGTIAWGGGCTATRPGSLPKLNLTWWKKDATGPGTRHNDLAPPSTTISPSDSLAAVEPADSTTKPVRKPYQIDKDSSAKSGPPAPRSFELSQQDPTKPNGAARPPEGSTNSQPIGSTVADNKSSEIPDSYAPRYSDQSSATMTEQPTAGDRPIAHVAQDTKPLRYVNPYVDQGAPSNGMPEAKNDSAPADSDSAASNASVYTRTPYNAFAPKTSTASPSVGSPLRPMSPPTTPAPATKGLPNIRPLEAAPSEISVTSANPGPSPPSSENLTSSSSQNSSLPDVLLQSQGSYAPGSIRTAPPALGIAPGQVQPFVMPVPSAPPAATAPLPSSTAPATSSNIGGGGSFMLSK